MPPVSRFALPHLVQRLGLDPDSGGVRDGGVQRAAGSGVFGGSLLDRPQRCALGTRTGEFDVHGHRLPEIFSGHASLARQSEAQPGTGGVRHVPGAPVPAVFDVLLLEVLPPSDRTPRAAKHNGTDAGAMSNRTDPLVVVWPMESSPQGAGRPVEVDTVMVGRADSWEELDLLLLQAGLPTDTVVLWRGGGADRWE